MHTISVIGHGWLKKMFYNRGGSYREKILPGGGMMLSEMLRNTGVDVSLTELDEPERHECLSVSPKKNDLGERFFVKEFFGWTGGNPMIYDNLDAESFAVWDEGFWGISELPEEKPVIWISNRVLPQKENFETVKENCFLLLDIAALRGAGVQIENANNWLGAARAVSDAVKTDPALSHINGTNYILVTFGLDGAVYMRKTEEGAYETVLTLPHGGPEGLLDNQLVAMPDGFSAVAAAVAAQYSNLRNGKPLDVMRSLGAGITTAALGYDLSENARFLDTAGFTNTTESFYID